MGKAFAVVRPESRDFHGRIYELVESLGYERGHGMVLPAGVPDERAARWANHLVPELLVLPYHLHRDAEGNALDGVGVALLLGPHYEGQVPILMGVSEFSMETRLDSRLHDLRAERPLIWKNVVVFGSKDIGSHRLTARILRTAGVSPSSIPSYPEAPTVRHGLGPRRVPSSLMPRVPPLGSYRAPELRISRADEAPQNSLVVPRLGMEPHLRGEGAAPSEPLPSEALPSEALPSEALPSEALPSEAPPSEALPSDGMTPKTSGYFAPGAGGDSDHDSSARKRDKRGGS